MALNIKYVGTYGDNITAANQAASVVKGGPEKLLDVIDLGGGMSYKILKSYKQTDQEPQIRVYLTDVGDPLYKKEVQTSNDPAAIKTWMMKSGF
jgi:hypothetical protein